VLKNFHLMYLQNKIILGTAQTDLSYGFNKDKDLFSLINLIKKKKIIFFIFFVYKKKKNFFYFFFFFKKKRIVKISIS